jgi:hypothetical protein
MFNKIYTDINCVYIGIKENTLGHVPTYLVICSFFYQQIGKMNLLNKSLTHFIHGNTGL